MAERFTYVGDQPVRELWGVTFPRGVAVKVDDPDLAKKCTALSDFEAGEVKIEPIAGQNMDVSALVRENEELKARIVELEEMLTAPTTEFDDYTPEQPDVFEEVEMPVIGSGVLPENWREAHWKHRQQWCRELLGLEVANGDEANTALERALKG